MALLPSIKKISFGTGTELRFRKYHYSLADAMCGIGNQLDRALASCSNASNTKEALRTVAIFATVVQCMTSHISGVTNHIIHIIKEGYSCFESSTCSERQKNWTVLTNEGCNFQHQFEKMHELMAGLISVFSEYSTDNLHPYFHHQSKLTLLQEQLKLLAVNSTGYLQPPYNQESKLPVMEVKRYQDEFLPRLYSLAMSLRNLVLVFDDTGKYSRSITLAIVKRFPLGSPERRQAILRLEQDGRAARASVYEELRSKFPMIVYDEWKRPVRQRVRNVSFAGCPGRILMDLCPIRTTLCEISDPDIRCEAAHMTMGIFSPRCYDLDSISHQRWKDLQFYFCPRRFPPPYDANHMWDCDSSSRLKWYIKHCSEKGGSPVFYNGGTGGTRRFRCTKRNAEGKKCKFGFSVRCDLIDGYYISFHSSSGCKVNHLLHDLHKK